MKRLEIYPVLTKKHRKHRNYLVVKGFRVYYDNLTSPGIQETFFKKSEFIKLLKDVSKILLEDHSIDIEWSDNAKDLKVGKYQEYACEAYLKIPPSSPFMKDEEGMSLLSHKLKDIQGFGGISKFSGKYCYIKILPEKMLMRYFLAGNIGNLKLVPSTIDENGNVVIGAKDCVETVDAMIDIIKISIGDRPGKFPELERELIDAQYIIRNILPGLYSEGCKSLEKE